MKKLSARFLLLLSLFTGSFSLTAYGQTPQEYAFLGLEPDIITNYISPSSRKLGYIRVTVELMIENVDMLEIAEHHMPLLRATTIEIFGQQPEEKVKSLTGREDIRLAILKALQDHMRKETGATIIKDVIFTKYLAQG
ncbi:flagellar basal body-associated protein FliL [Alteromonas sp. C1M14]|uniref:flagellar basal body-associated protein FliL n=1 Tax=Alteromonas sp. C1M14 TaxID=2841567 RepID=UPI001C098018|nr:flagellar basal body-associated protein FliL [Alteromonas sp. C1M14]MBU2979852.1 flagellar basal body-associated protein FliL [Alteromonas sp. C1M14]